MDSVPLKRAWIYAIGVPALTVSLLATGCTSAPESSAVESETPAPTTQRVVNAAPPVSEPVPVSPVVAVDSLPGLIEQVIDSVVLIENMNGLGSGSGMVIDLDGHILTNFHVVEQMDRIKVTLYDGSASMATVVGTDPSSDLAVIHADGFDRDQLQPVAFGDSTAMRVGEPVFAVGNPFNEHFSVTQGIISALNRSSASLGGRSIQGVIQTDAALNPGNSGGPLFNLSGEVIGINTSIRNPQGQSFAGLGFAVPSNTATRYLDQLVAGEPIDHPQLGVGGPVQLDEVSAAELGVTEDRGLYITSIVPGGAAGLAGVQSGDILLEVNGQQTHSFEELARAIEGASVGDEIEIVLVRNGERMTVTATLQPWSVS